MSSKKVISQPKNIKDIAALTGISYATVSRVINGHSTVNEKTRQKVLDVIEKYNFTPNFFARGIHKNSTQTIALIVSSCYEPTYAPLLATTEALAREKKLSILTSNSLLQPEKEKAIIEDMTHRGVDGILLDPCLKNQKFLQTVAQQVPITLVNKAMPKHNAFYVNNIDAAQKLLTALVQMTPAPWVLVTNPVEKDKMKGWLQAAKSLKLKKGQAFTCQMDELNQKKSLSGTYVFTFRRDIEKLRENIPINHKGVLIPFDYVPEIDFQRPPCPMCILPSVSIAKAAFQHLYENIQRFQKGQALLHKREILPFTISP